MHADYVIKFRKALALPVLILGVERKLFFFELVILLSMAIATRLSYLIFFVPLIGLLLHGFCLVATKSDPLISALFVRSRRHYPNYHPALSSPEYMPNEKVLSSFPERGATKHSVSFIKNKLKKIFSKKGK